METDEDGAFSRPQSLGNDDGSSLPGRNEPDDLQYQWDLDEARHEETQSPVSGIEGNILAAEEASGDMVGGKVQTDVPEKDQSLVEVAEMREVITVEDEDASGGVEKQEVKIADLSDAGAEATGTSDDTGGSVDIQAKEIENLDDTEQKRETVIGDSVENDMVAAVGDGNAFVGESSLSEHVGWVDKVVEEKDLDEAVTEVPHVAEEEVNLAETGTTYEMKESAAERGGSMDKTGKMAEEKDLDEAVVGVPHVAEGGDLDGTATKYQTESSLSEHVGSTDMLVIVAKEKGLDGAVVDVPPITEVSLDGTATRDVMGSAVSVDVGGMVSEEKDLDTEAGEVLHVTAEEVNIGETMIQKDWEVLEVGVETAKEDELVKADQTTIDTGNTGLDSLSNMALEAIETDRMDDETGKVVHTNQADDTAMEMEKGESEMAGDAVQVNEEVNRMIYEDAPMESDGRGVDTAVKNNNIVDNVKIMEVSVEFDGDDMLEKTAEAEDMGAEIEVAEQENMVRLETEEAEEDAYGSCMVEETVKEEDAYGSCMVEETVKEEDAEVAYEVDYMDDEADAAYLMGETMDGEEAERTEESEEHIRSSASGKRKRGRDSKGSGRAPLKKKPEEDVCFICFDGGELVLCDRRGCPKAYHPSCVNRDEAFFKSKGRWNCGWHLCSNCEKNAYYMCYTCTFSLCKGCVKDAVILCVRGNKGFCETCMRTIMLIEQKEQGNKDMQGQVNFDDKSSWEYLFKDYWMNLKSRLSLTLVELAQAKNPWKGSEPLTTKEAHRELHDDNKDRGSDSDSSWGNIELKSSKRKKPKKRLKSRPKDGDSQSTVTGEGPSGDGSIEWASKELLEFVMHMRNGDMSVLSQFDVQALLLEYIKRNKLRDPRRKSQIICDARLQNLFVKPRVGHFEMLKLLESHFLLKEDSQVEDLQETVVDTEASQLEGDRNSESFTKAVKDKKRKTRKKSDDRSLQSNLDDYAAIDTHNINLIYLKRKLAEDLIENAETFHDKVVGSFARIRISAGGQKQDLYRLVQVVGTCKGTEPYKLGKMMTDTLLEILNLNKKEVISIDIISNQEFTEDECKRLRQSIKCGLINRLTVGDIREKAMALQEVRVKDWLEAEILRVSHLRDRASDMGRRKELRECVEKLQMLKAPEERQRRLEEIPEIHADPNMDPSHESEEDEVRQENNLKPRASGFSRRGREPISPKKSGGPQCDSWNGTRNHFNANRELNRSMSNKGFTRDVTDMTSTSDMGHDSPWKQGRDIDKESLLSSSWEKPKLSSSAEICSRNNRPVVMSGPFSSASEGSPSNAGGVKPAPKINETEKMWYYKDPSGKVQGPFSMVQLRKWNNSGYFPADLGIWKSSGTQEDSILLTDALAGKFQKEPSLLLKNRRVHDSHQSSSYSGKPLQNVEAQLAERSHLVQSGESWDSCGGSPGRPVSESKSSKDNYSLLAGKPASLYVEVPNNSTSQWGTDHVRKSELMNLPSPTPQSTPGGAKAQAFENKWGRSSDQSSASVLGMSSLTGVANGLQSPAAVIPDSAGQGSGSASLNSLPTAPVSTPFLATNSLNPALLQNLVQSMSNYNTQAETKGWRSPLVSKSELAASIHGGESKAWVNTPPQRIEQHNAAVTSAQWDSTTPVQNPNFNTGNTTGTYSAASFPGMTSTETWRQTDSVSQSNGQPTGAANPQWGVGVANNQGGVPRPITENHNMSWGMIQGNQNMGWAGQVPTNTNANWLPGQLPASSNVNPGWTASMQGSSAVGALPGRTGPTQGQPQMSANQGWVAPGQGPPPANANCGWNPPSTNPNMWGAEQSHCGNRHMNTGDRGPHGGDSGYSGNQPWNRHSSFNGGGGGGVPGRPPFRGQRVCKYHESGHCKKGASCDYFHN